MNFAVALEHFAEAPALLVPDSAPISYQQLANLCQQQQSELQQLPAHSLLALDFAPTVASVVLYLAALRTGYPLLLVDPELTTQQRQSLFNQLQVVACYNSAGQRQLTGHQQTCRKDLALLLSTSGSSGSPKSVMLGVQQLQANAEAIAAYLPITASDVAISNLPLHYSYGLSVLNSHLYRGAAMVLTAEPVLSKAFWQQLRQFDVTSLAGVPFHYQLFRQLRLERMELPALRYLTQAGGRLGPELTQYVQQLSARIQRPIYLMYGQTEATARIAYLPPEFLDSHGDCIGQAIPGGQLYLKDLNTGQALRQTGQTGELVYQGDNIMLGYAYSAADLTSDSTLSELVTGDLAEQLENGLFRIVGRLNRMIKIRGRRLQLDNLEQQLAEQGFELVATGRDDMLQLSCKTETDLTLLQQWLRQQLGLHPSLFQLRHDHDWPRLSNGKLDYPALRQLFED